MNTKTLIAALFTCLLGIMSGMSSEWTIHNSRDNCLTVSIATNWVQVVEGNTIGAGFLYETSAYWDFGHDALFPEEVWSYSYSSVFSVSDPIETYTSGYSDVQVLRCSGSTTATILDEGGGGYNDIWLCGPYPDYLGVLHSEMPWESGEYWIDFASDLTVRISTTQPSDFGKWAWDGSINPSWVEPPLAPVTHKRGKGHNK